MLRFREIAVNDGSILDIPKNALCVSIHVDRTMEMMTTVAWFEEVEE